MKNQAREIKSERVQKMVINNLLNRCMYVAGIFKNGLVNEYLVEVEDEGKPYQKVVVTPNGGTCNDFISSPVMMEFINKTKDIMEKYSNCFWCISTRERLTEDLEWYHVPVIEFFTNIKK